MIRKAYYDTVRLRLRTSIYVLLTDLMTLCFKYLNRIDRFRTRDTYVNIRAVAPSL